MQEINFTDIGDIEVGHAQDFDAATGCTVVLCRKGAMGGVDVRGSSPSTRETDGLNPVNVREHVHAVLLTGGSAFGLDAAAGVMQFLEENDVGRDVLVAKVPIVCGAVIFDLKCGRSDVRPDKEMGYAACKNATVGPFAVGSVGAGTGATVGKLKGPEFAMKGGIGTCSYQLGELKVGALMVVNALGDIYDEGTQQILAGALCDDRKHLADTESLMLSDYSEVTDVYTGNTVIGVVATNAKLTKDEANKLASIAHDGLARAVRPAHTTFDGDSIFTMATGEVQGNFNVVALLAARAVETAIIRAVKSAESVAGVPAYKDLFA
ncbi:MAG: P1 family peptidase [Oscillospiraceae bacterium]|jgi:L-aminopeptidase/D-esterase-like protein